jgi:hypothetical protein
MDSESDRLLGLVPGIARSKDLLEVLKADRRLVKSAES